MNANKLHLVLVNLSKLSFLIAVLVFSFACKSKKNTANVEGHFKNYSEEKLLPYKNNLVAIAEYEPSQGVIFTAEADGLFNKADIAKMFNIFDAIFIGNYIEPKYFEKYLEKHSDFKQKIKNIGQVDSVWARDWSPIFARNTITKSLVAIDFNYYNELVQDNNFPANFSNEFKIERVSLPIYSEGGNFMITSKGVCALTERIAHSNTKDTQRSSVPEDIFLNHEQISQYLKDYLGCQTVELFPRIPDEATGHIDMVAKFLDNETVVVGKMAETPELKKYTNYLDNLAKRFAELDTLTGKKFKVLRIPMPKPDSRFFSYTNSLIYNGTVVMPSYLSNNQSDSLPENRDVISKYEVEAMEVYKAAGFKNIIKIDSLDAIESLGAVHCTIMQVPK